MQTLLAIAAALLTGYGVYAESISAFFVAGILIFFIMIDEFGYDIKKPSGRTR